MNTKQKGNIAMAEAIRYFTIKGYVVLIPLNDSQKYDLAVEIDNLLFKVECKYTTYKSPSGNYQLDLRSSGGTKGSTYHKLSNEDCDYIFLTTSDLNSYLIPMLDIENQTTLSINDKIKQKYGCLVQAAEDTCL